MANANIGDLDLITSGGIDGALDRLMFWNNNLTGINRSQAIILNELALFTQTLQKPLNADAFDIEFDDGSGLSDMNSKKILEVASDTNSVNNFSIMNSNTGVDLEFGAKGTDTNININFVTAGTGVCKVNGETILTDSGLTTINGLISNTGFGTPPTITVDQNNYNPAAMIGLNTCRIAASDPVSITGFVPGTTASRQLNFTNIGTNPIRFTNEDGASTAANRFGFGSDAFLYEGESLIILYDSTTSRWRKYAHTGENKYVRVNHLTFADTGHAADGTDQTFYVDCSGGVTVVNLPTAFGREGRRYSFIKTDASVNNLQINTNGSELINNFGFQTLGSQFATTVLKGHNILQGGWYIF